MKNTYLQYYPEDKVEEFTAISYRIQIVQGHNYYVKVRTGPGSYVHLRIYKDLAGQVSLDGVLTNKTVFDPIEYFGPNIEH